MFDRDHPRYRWVALSNTTLGTLMATINSSIVIIALPAIFTGIRLNPLEPANVSYLLWILMGYMLVTAVLVVSFGRLGDIYGRVRIYNLGFVVFTAGSIALAFDPFTGSTGAMWLILWRLVQGVGGAMLFANSTAILTDAFPAHRRGLALGTNQVAAIAGSFIGLIVGGLLAAITYGIQPYGTDSTGFGNPWVLAGILGGIALLVIFVFIELHSSTPMFAMRLFRIRAFTLANLAGLLASIGRGGMQFMLIIWLQGIWLPLHGYSYESTPLWAGIYLLPITIGFLVAGPLSGALSDRFGAKAFATIGLLLVTASFVGLLLIPVNFDYWQLAALTGLSGIGSGLFSAPNRTAIMNSVPANQRGSASGMAGTLLNAGSSLSIGIFFSLMIAGLAQNLPSALRVGLTANGVPSGVAATVAQTPPVGSLFAAFLGYNPIQSLLAPTGVLQHLSHANIVTLTGKQFFPELISGPFHDGLIVVFVAAAIMSLIAAIASVLRGVKYLHEELPVELSVEESVGQR